MKLVNTYISNDCTRKCLVYVDKNGHYWPTYKKLYPNGWSTIIQGREKFKHIESLNRAVAKWLKMT